MSTLISRNSSKWNNYYRRCCENKHDLQTADYLVHLQQQIDRLEKQVYILKEAFKTGGNENDNNNRV